MMQTVQRRAQVEGLLHAGLGIQEIADTLGVHRTTVQRDRKAIEAREGRRKKRAPRKLEGAPKYEHIMELVVRGGLRIQERGELDGDWRMEREGSRLLLDAARELRQGDVGGKVDVEALERLAGKVVTPE